MATYISIETDKKISYQIDGGDKQTMFANIDDGYPEPTGTITITENGTGIDVKDYAEADVNVPTSGYPEPTGTITITQNGTNIDVKDYAAADVAVPSYPEPTGTKQISITQNGTTTENVKDYASAEITVNVPSGGTDYLPAFVNNTLTSYSSPDITAIRPYAFASSYLHNISVPNAEILSSYAFSGCSYLEGIVLPKVNQINGGSYVFNSCNNLEFADFGEDFATVGTGGIGVSFFQNASKLDTVILRTTSKVVPLAVATSFNGTPFASSGTGGTLYVPEALISSYQAATNWDTILGYATNSIQKIEGSYYETHYADGTLIPTT